MCAVQASGAIGMVFEARDAVFVTLGAGVGIGFVVRMVADGGSPKGLLYRRLSMALKFPTQKSGNQPKRQEWGCIQGFISPAEFFPSYKD